jgi:hypothetical protein
MTLKFRVKSDASKQAFSSVLYLNEESVFFSRNEPTKILIGI